MQRRVRIAAIAAGVIFGAFGAGYLTAGPLDPPGGSVASTYKTLSEIEPRIAINATNTPGAGYAVFSITQPGSYYLSSDLLIAEPFTLGIAINSGDVTIDLNGFRVDGLARSTTGVESSGPRIVVRNGRILSCNRVGINLPFSDGCTVEDVLVEACGSGIALRDRGVVNRCIAARNAGTGIAVRDDSVVSNCVSNTNQTGIVAGDGSTVEHCSVNRNTGRGISVNNGCRITANLTRNNALDGIAMNFSCDIRDNNCNGDGMAAGSHGAITVFGQANRLDSNNITFADRGVLVASGGNTIIRNSVKGCTVNFDIVAGNDVGPIGSAATATSPWANIQY